MEENNVQTVQTEVTTATGSVVKKGVNKWLVGGVSALVLLGVAIVPINGTSLLSKGLDAVGLQKAALLVDSVSGAVTGGSGFDISKVNVKDGASCENAWNQIKEISRKTISSENDATVSLSYKTGDQKEVVKLGIAAETKSDLSKYVNSNLITGSFKLDIPYILDQAKLASPESADSINQFSKLDLGVVNASVKLDLTTNTADTALKLVSAKVDANNLKFDESDFGDAVRLAQNEPTEEHKVSFKKTQDAMVKFSETKLKDVLSDDTGKALAKATCDVLEDIKVQSFGDYTLSNGQKINGRKATIVLKPFNIEALYDNSNNLAKKIVKDETLKSFIKKNRVAFAEYVKSVLTASSLGVANPTTTEQTEEEFNKKVDESFANAEKSLNESTDKRPDFKEVQKFLDYVDFKFDNSDFYFNGQGIVIATDLNTSVGISATKIDDTVKLAQDQSNGSKIDAQVLKNILSGRLSGSAVSGKNLVNTSPTIVTPTKLISTQDFITYIQSKKSVTDFITKVQNRFSSIAPTTSGSDINSLTLPSDGTGSNSIDPDLIFQ
jgi:hypothetical protein